MASYTGNLNLKKPALDDDALITDINNNMDILDAAVNGIQDGLAIVANGNTHVAITSGQFVYVRNHSTLTEGLYVASTNIAANATLSSSNLTADAAGGLNALNGKIQGTVLRTVTTNGEKTWSQLIQELFSGVSFGNNTIIVFDGNRIFRLFSLYVKEFIQLNYSDTSYAKFVIRSINGSNYSYHEGVGTIAVIDYSNSVPDSGSTISLVTFA